MSTFVQKLRTVTLGTVHDLLDKAIDANSPSALRQYTRDLEDALDKMRNEGAVAAGTVRTYEREIEEATSKITTGKTVIQQLTANGHPDLARIKATEIVQTQKQLDLAISNLATQRTSSAAIDKAVSQLEVKHTSMVQAVRQLERMDVDTKAKEQTARALSAAGRLIGGGADISIDDISGKMKARNDVANAKFTRAMGDVNVTEDPETTANVDALLAELTPAKAVGA